MADRPNVIYFQVDNLGYGELGCYGGGVLRGPTRDASTSSPRRVSSSSTSPPKPNARPRGRR